jgi:hypothetical protein
VVVHWEGWGWTAFFIPMGWMFVVFGFPIFTGYYEPDPHKLDRALDLLFALWMVLSAASIYAIDRWREAKAQRNVSAGPVVETRRLDTFFWVRLYFWPYLYAALSLGGVIKSFFA